MSNFTENIFNTETGEETIVEFSAEQKAEAEAAITMQKEQAKEVEAKAIARQAILDRLGLTEEEARLFLS
jgi:hypothetical protein